MPFITTDITKTTAISYKIPCFVFSFDEIGNGFETTDVFAHICRYYLRCVLPPKANDISEVMMTDYLVLRYWLAAVLGLALNVIKDFVLITLFYFFPIFIVLDINRLML